MYNARWKLNGRIEKFGNPILFTRQLTLYQQQQQQETVISNCTNTNRQPTLTTTTKAAAKKQQSNAQPFLVGYCRIRFPTLVRIFSKCKFLCSQALALSLLDLFFFSAFTFSLFFLFFLSLCWFLLKKILLSFLYIEVWNLSDFRPIQRIRVLNPFNFWDGFHTFTPVKSE